MADKFDYALLSDHVYAHTEDNKINLDSSGWEELTWVPDDPITGFSAGAYKKGNEIVIAFAGTNEEKFADSVYGNIPGALGLGLLSFDQGFQAMTFALDVILANPGASISFTGHSLGGGLASLMAVFFGSSGKGVPGNRGLAWGLKSEWQRDMSDVIWRRNPTTKKGCSPCRNHFCVTPLAAKG